MNGKIDQVAEIGSTEFISKSRPDGDGHIAAPPTPAKLLEISADGKVWLGSNLNLDQIKQLASNQTGLKLLMATREMINTAIYDAERNHS